MFVLLGSFTLFPPQETHVIVLCLRSFLALFPLVKRTHPPTHSHRTRTAHTASHYPFIEVALQRHDAEWRNTPDRWIKTFYRICWILTLWFFGKTTRNHHCFPMDTNLYAWCQWRLNSDHCVQLWRLIQSKRSQPIDMEFFWISCIFLNGLISNKYIKKHNDNIFSL